MRYTISIREVHISHRDVEADSVDEAVIKALTREYDNERMEYSHTEDDAKVDVYDTETCEIIVEDYKLG